MLETDFWRITMTRLVSHTGDEVDSTLNQLDYTSPVFFWTNIELSTAVISACLPTYRPIWMFLRGKPIRTKGSGAYSSNARPSKSYGSSSRYSSKVVGSQRLDSKNDDLDVALTTSPRVDTRINAVNESWLDDSNHSIGQSITVEQSICRDSIPLEQVRHNA